MNVKILLTVLFLSLVALSCSKDEGMMGEEKNAGETASANAVFEVSLSGDGTATKAGTEPPISSEYAISNCFIAVMNTTGDVLGSYWFGRSDLTAAADQATSFIMTINKSFVVKVPADKPELTFLAIANLSEEAEEGKATSSQTLLSYTKKEDFDMFLLENEDPTVLVKIGRTSASNYTTVDNPGNHDHALCTTVTIPVSQRSAAFMLETIKTTGEVPVEVIALKMLNIKLASYLDKEYSFVESDENVATYYSDSDVKSGDYTQIRFYGYENTSANIHTAIQIDYKINNVPYSRTFTIKDEGRIEKVLAGHLYKLSVTIGADKVEGYFKVQDWIPNMLGVGDITPDRSKR